MVGFPTTPRGPALKLRTRTWFLLGIPAILVITGIGLYPAWKRASDRGGQLPAEPFRIAGNFYYVGANDVSSFLLTGPEGHILIDGGYPATPPMIIASIARLGFDIRDVKILLNSEPHLDHAGGLAALQQASGARLWASDASAVALTSGGDDPIIPLPLRALIRLGIISYPAARVDHRVQDGDTVRLGPLAVVAHLTPGHTRGCTSWTTRVQDGARTLNVISACSLIMLGHIGYPGQEADLERSIATLRSLPVDVWVTSHARLWGRYRKFLARDSAANPVEPFIDPAGYRAYLDTALARVRRGEKH